MNKTLTTTHSDGQIIPVLQAADDKADTIDSPGESYQNLPTSWQLQNQWMEPKAHDIMTWEHFLQYWPFVSGIHQSHWDSYINLLAICLNNLLNKQ